MQNHKKYKIAFILVAIIIIILLSFTLFLYIKAPIFFKPKNKVIQYQEEVKLSDGSMIWVDIKRHYWLSGGALGDAGMFTGNYMPGIVEISWDTGFEGVGRQSVSFVDDIYLLDKIDGGWYVIGNTYGQAYDFDKSRLHNCVKNGTYVPKLDVMPKCLVIIDKEGNFEHLPQNTKKDVYFNILNTDFIEGFSTPPSELNEKKLSWQQKLNLQQHQPEFSRSIGKTYQAYALPLRSYSNE